jgi:hypothetical protein
MQDVGPELIARVAWKPRTLIVAPIDGVGLMKFKSRLSDTSAFGAAGLLAGYDCFRRSFISGRLLMPRSRPTTQAMLDEGRKTFRLRHRSGEASGRDTPSRPSRYRRTVASAPASRRNPAPSVGLSGRRRAAGLSVKPGCRQSNLDDPATTIALLKLNAVVRYHGLANPGTAASNRWVSSAFCH